MGDKVGGILRLAGIEESSIVDGPGLRMTVFTQGCPHHCAGCQNPSTHDFDKGFISTVDAVIDRYRSDPLLRGVTLSGGEPFCQPEPLIEIAERVRDLGGDVVTFTGYVFEGLIHRSHEIDRLLELTDILIDGPYIESLRDIDLLYRGSSNQRILDRDARRSLMR